MVESGDEMNQTTAQTARRLRIEAGLGPCGAEDDGEELLADQGNGQHREEPDPEQDREDGLGETGEVPGPLRVRGALEEDLLDRAPDEVHGDDDQPEGEGVVPDLGGREEDRQEQGRGAARTRR